MRAQARAPPATAVISKDPRAPSPAPAYTIKSSRRTSEPIPSAAATALAPDTPWRTPLRTKIAGATYAPTTYAGAIAIRHGPSTSVTKPMPKRRSMGTAISAKAHTKTGRSVPMSEGGPFACTPSQSSRSGRDLSPKPGQIRETAPLRLPPAPPSAGTYGLDVIRARITPMQKAMLSDSRSGCQISIPG